MKKLVTIAAAVMIVASAQAAQIGDTVESVVTIFDRIQVSPNTVADIAFVDVEDGVWSMSGSVNLFVQGPNGKIVFYAGGITPDTIDATDGRTVFGSVTIWNGRVDPPIPVVSRDIDIVTPPHTTKRIYLSAWVYPSGFTPGNIQAYGFLSGRKIRNN
jgi:hypothetical protein